MIMFVSSPWTGRGCEGQYPWSFQRCSRPPPHSVHRVSPLAFAPQPQSLPPCPLLVSSCSTNIQQIALSFHLLQTNQPPSNKNLKRSGGIISRSSPSTHLRIQRKSRPVSRQCSSALPLHLGPHRLPARERTVARTRPLPPKAAQSSTAKG